MGLGRRAREFIRKGKQEALRVSEGTHEEQLQKEISRRDEALSRNHELSRIRESSLLDDVHHSNQLETAIHHLVQRLGPR